MASKQTVLYFYTIPSTFVEKDLQILSEKYLIRKFLFKGARKIDQPFLLIKQFLFILFFGRKSKLFISQFAGYHSLLPGLLGKVLGTPSLIITGGTDSVSFPSLKYGNFYKTFPSFFTKWSYNFSSHIAPVHQSLILCDYTYENDNFPKQGFKFFCPENKTPCTVIHNGYDSEKWYKSAVKKKNHFITVASFLEFPLRVKLKGVDLIIEVAQYFPEAHFSIIGLAEGNSLSVKSNNITFYPFIANKELRNFYSEHEFYMQLSISEGFPNAICEAMLCECIPIGSNVASIPDIIGDSGFILKKRDIHELKSLITETMRSDKTKLADKSRRRIIELFPERKRKEELLSLADSLINKKD